MRGRGLNRRDAAALIAVAALLPLGLLGAPLGPARAARRPARAPEGNFLLERVLARDLSDGASIVVTRRWRAAFLPRDRGMFVEGEQIFAAVAAPPGLQALASLEQSRAATAMFPIALDAAGLIVGTAQQSEDDHLLRAVEKCRTLVERSGALADRTRDANKFLAELARMTAQAVSMLPRDLFFPLSGRNSATQAIAVPGGEPGSISVAAAAATDPASGLLRTSERVITTRIGTSERASKELWTLARF